MKKLNEYKYNRFSKKIICIILSVIIAFGTFFSMTLGNLFLSDYADLITAFAIELSPVPVFYRHGELVGLYRVNYSDTTTLQYKIGENGVWTDYSVPFAIPAHQTTKVYARIGTTGRITYMNFSTTDEALGVYTESNTDFEFSYNGIDFGYTRIYNSADKNWFESIHSKVLATNSRLEVTLPDNTKYPMIRKTANTYVDELTGKTLTKTSTDYIFDDGYYKYFFAINNLNSISYLSAIEDNNGNRLNLNRTTSSEEISISDGTGRSFYISDYYVIEAPDGSDANYYSVKEITDPNNNKIRYTTKHGRYISVVDQAGVTLGDYDYVSDTTDYTLTESNGNTIEYYANGRLKKITYQNGSWIQYTYTDSEKVYTTLTSSGETTRTVYNDAFLPVEYTDELGETTTYTYDDHYRVLTESCGTETTTYTYDANGNVVSYITGDTESNTYYTYDSNKRVVREQTGDSYTYYTYDSNGNNLVYATLKEDYTGEAPALYDSSLTCFDTVCYTYDDKGRVTSEVYSNGGSVSYEYDNRGNVTKETTVTVENEESTTSVVNYTYDSFGNLLTSSSGNDTSSYVYDAAGRTLLANENGECTRTLYDNLGRVVQEISPEDYDSTKDGLPTENTYSDANVGHRYFYNEETGNLDREINRLDVETTYTYYDTGEKETESFDIYKYDYNIKGNLTKVYVDGVNTLTYNYDEDYNLTSEVYANGQSIRYEYDDNNNLVRQFHNNDTSAYVTYSYNEDNELIQKVNTDTGLRYEYDGENVEVYRIADNTLVQSYSQVVTEADEENDVEARTDVTETHFGTTYSSVVKDNSISYTTGNNTVEYGYTENDASIISDSVKYNNSNALNSSYTYDDDGNVTEKNYGNSRSVINAYDTEGRISSTSYNNKTYNYTYDANSQLTAVNGTNYSASYAYDSRGNITNKTVNGTSTTFGYSSDGWNDKLTSVNGTALTYDANGNVLTYGSKSFTWSSGRNLAQITDGNNTYSYSYDENGIRTSKTVNGVTTYYNTKDGVILSQTDGTNTMYFQYASNGTPLGFVLNGTQYFYITNQMNDVLAITDTSGTIVGNYEYDAWGKVLTADTDLAQQNPIRYRGYYCDNETGYYYLQSRYYDPSICRFINADLPEYAQCQICLYVGTNLFVYCCNNPIDSSDSFGCATNKVDSNVTISNFIKKYKLDQSSFNCFSYAIGVYSDHTYIPQFTYKSSIYDCRDNTVNYLKRKGYRVKDVTNNGGYKYKTSGHTWLIALRIGSFRSGGYIIYDFHFMLRSNLNNIWSFKGGKGGAVYNLKSGKNPSNVNWNIYCLNDTKIKYEKVYYSKIIYLAISN